MIVRADIPKEVQHVADTLENRGFEAYLVGGCVRDLLLSTHHMTGISLQTHTLSK